MRICVKPLSTLTRHARLRHLIALFAGGAFVSVGVAAAILAAPSCGWAGTLSAQTSRPQAPMSFPARKADQPPNNPTGAQPAPAATPAAVTATPPAPDWPAYDTPTAASVDWDGHSLRIEASNSSLAQILKDVTAKTGTNLQGFGEDQRVFGTFGPGTARDVLAQLLDGSGYNVMIVGDRGQGAPRRIVLSVRPAAGAQPAAPAYQPQSDADAEADQQQDQQPEEPLPPQANPAPIPGRPMGDFMQQQRQLQMQQQMQQQQQPPPQQPPQNPQN